jgi:hypothetical protein
VSKLRGAHKKVANLFLTGKGRNSCSMERKEHSNKKNFQRCFNFRKVKKWGGQRFLKFRSIFYVLHLDY